jgi:hypothetical protein
MVKSDNSEKKQNKDVPTEKIFGDFLELLEIDSEDLYTGFLFKFISQLVAHTMGLGKEGFAPVLNITLYARQKGVDGFELFCRPSRSVDEEVYKKLKLGELGQKFMDAFESYAVKTWGMTPIIDEREDLRGVVKSGHDAVDQWSAVVQMGNKGDK